MDDIYQELFQIAEECLQRVKKYTDYNSQEQRWACEALHKINKRMNEYLGVGETCEYCGHPMEEVKTGHRCINCGWTAVSPEICDEEYRNGVRFPL